MRQPNPSTTSLSLDEECREDQATISAVSLTEKVCYANQNDDDDCATSVTSATTSSDSDMLEDDALPACRSSFKSASSSSENKRVSFDSITVHYHSVSLGDSPSVRNGPPLTLTWKRLGTRVYHDVEQYESIRPKPRKAHKMRMRSSRREKVLKRAGVSEIEMEKCMNEIKAIQLSMEMEQWEAEYLRRSSYDSEDDAFEVATGGDDGFSWLDMICVA